MIKEFYQQNVKLIECILSYTEYINKLMIFILFKKFLF